MENILNWVFYSLHKLSKFWQQSGLHICFLLKYCFLSNHNSLSLKASWIYFLWWCFVFCILVLRKCHKTSKRVCLKQTFANASVSYHYLKHWTNNCCSVTIIIMISAKPANTCEEGWNLSPFRFKSCPG